MTHLLVIDENEDLTENIRELFEDTGARVSVLQNAEGLEALAADPFDLAIVDVRLGPSGGASLLPRLRQVSHDGEVIVMTGSATVHSAMAAVRHGVFAYLSKPFDPEDLLRLADRALGQVALRRERTLLSRDLARSEALHRAVFDTVESLIVGVDEQHRVQLWNESAAQTTGWRAIEVLGRDAGDVLLREAHQKALRQMVVAATTTGGSREARLPIQTRDGEERIVHWHVRPLVLDTMGGPMVLLAGTDLTERLEAERRAASAEAMAAMGRLTSALAHEIRNPLNAATLQLELLRRSARKSKHDSIERRAVVVADELKRLTSMLDDFLGLARPKHFAMEGVAPESIVNAVYELQEPAARAAGITFSVSVASGVPEIYADAGRLKQALLNLVVNAFDAMAERSQGRVEIELMVQGETVVMAVNDDGPGLPDGQRVLEPFETTKEGGTGLGLPIVKRIAQMHGGTLSIGPRPGGQGTRAAIVLPLENDPAQVMRTPA